MAQLAFGVAGAGVGGAFGGSLGAQLGYTAGSLIGGLFFPPDDIIQEGSRLNNQLTTTSAYGVMRPIYYGTVPINGNIIDGSGLYERRNESKQDAGGKGGLGGGQQVVNVWYTYSIDLAVGLGVGEIEGVLKIYANDKLIYDVSPGARVVSPQWLNVRIYQGNETQLPDPTLQVLHGEDTPAYRGEAYVVFTRFQLEQFGNQIPSFRFLVVKKSNPVVSYDTISFAPGGNIGAFLQDKRSSLLYYASSGQDGVRAGYVYDPRSEKSVISLRWSEDFVRMDEAGGGGLFSIPSVVQGVTIQAGPNAHFFVNVEDTGNQPALAVYEARTGAYIGLIQVPILETSNTKCLVPDERDGIFYRVHQDSQVFYSYLEAWSVRIQPGLGGPFVVTSLGQVQIPIPGRDGILQWRWQEIAPYPEGTTRTGTIAIIGDDLVSAVDYLCLVDLINPRFVDKFVQLTGYTYQNVTAICWDSIQQYFWVMGESDGGATKTRIKAFDLDGAEQYSEEWDNTLWDSARHYFTFDESNFSIWLYSLSSGELLQWHTVNREFASVTSGYPVGGAGTGDSLVYVPMTRAAWRKRDNANIDIYRRGRIQDTGLGLDQVVADLCQRAGLQPAQYNVTELASATVDGYPVTSDGSIRAKLVPLQQTYLFDGIDKGDLIDFKFRGQSLEARIPFDDLGAGSSEGERIEINRVMDLDLPGKTEITYYNRDMEYEQNTQLARRWASNVKENSVRITLPIVITDDEGIQLADITEHLAYIEREAYNVRVLPGWQYLSTADVIELDAGNRIYRARVIRKSFEDGLVSLTCVKENSAILQSFLSGGQAPGREVTIRYNPLMHSVHLDIPLLLEGNNNPGYYLSACGFSPDWTGGNLYKSPDGSTWNLLTSVLTPSTIGTMDQALAPVLEHSLWDRTSVARVYMRCGELESKTEAEVLKGENAVALGAHGRWEIVGFANATLVEPGVYDVDTFVRGRLGTEWAVNTHELGDRFCLLTPDDLSYIQDSLINLDIPFSYRAVSLGENLYGDRVIDQIHVNTGVCLKPYAPALFEFSKNPTTLDIILTWRYRSRFIWRDPWSGVASDPRNAQLEIILPDASTKMVLITDDDQYLYTRADQLTDGFDPNISETANCTVYQVSESVGNGYPETQQIIVGPILDPFVVYAITIGANPLWELGETSGSTAVEYFGAYDGGYGGTPTLGQPSLLPSGYRSSVEFTGAQWFGSGQMPGDNTVFPEIDFSMSFLVAPQVSSTKEQVIFTGFFWTGSGVDFIRIYWLANGTIRIWFEGWGKAILQQDTGYTLPVGSTSLIVITFSAPALDVNGDFKVYAAGSEIGSFSNAQMGAAGLSVPRYVLGAHAVSTTAITVDTMRMSQFMIYDHALTIPEIQNLYTSAGL